MFSQSTPPSTVAGSVSGASDSSSLSSALQIPDHWRPEVEQCINEKMLTESARHDIVRTLVNQLFTRASKPDRFQCEAHARRLILKYPFFKDDMGNGYVSYSL